MPSSYHHSPSPDQHPGPAPRNGSTNTETREKRLGRRSYVHIVAPRSHAQRSVAGATVALRLLLLALAISLTTSRSLSFLAWSLLLGTATGVSWWWALAEALALALALGLVDPVTLMVALIVAVMLSLGGTWPITCPAAARTTKAVSLIFDDTCAATQK